MRAHPEVDVTVEGTPTAYRHSTSAPQISLTARDSRESDWFDLGVSVTVDGQHVPFATLFSALAAGRTRLVLLSGTYFSLQRPEFGMHRFQWSENSGVEYHLSHGDWIRLLRANGFEILDLIEIQAPPDAETHEHYAYVTADWARKWPAEEIWRARLHRPSS